ncbi:MAG: efflux RND transporter periplasmic adaptor subunit [Dissulfurimicrobium sp.]|uniref:efflux RND transporter periplasmic adaptor subunit n=1 Tax=Dissulfurimicrobium TaxID=1769732 RepID=UPI001EDB281C|nr:efflux RND transporter periplasmic adaptor subunit [Dissulfurimicrobium hydrothermale]UKL12910.1 efflux RND transporter periplasmic adaptor subunit [Dissulfurimicrobium hydrothermale]
MRLTKKQIVLRLVIPLLVLGGVAFYVFGIYKRPSGNVITLYGNVDIRQVNLAFDASGRIERMLVKEGDVVKSGQLLAELDVTRYEANLKKAEAQVASQKEVVAALLAGTRHQQIAAARARVRRAEVVMRDAEANYGRLKGLVDKGLVSKQAFDDAEANFKAAKAELDAAHQDLDLAVEGPRKEDIAAAKSTLKAYEAALDYARREFEDTRLYAPSSGIIENRILEPGDMVSPNTPVFTLALFDPVWVRAYIDEPDLGRIRLGMPAEVTTDSFPGKVYKGWVGFISPTAEFTPKPVETTELRTKLVYQVRVFVSNPQGELRLGMPATVKIVSSDGAGSKGTVAGES